MEFRGVVAVIVALAAVILDVRTRRIPNVLTFGAAALAVVSATITWGWAGLGWAAAGWLVGAALFLPIFALGGMGAGDVKLLAALAAWLGPHEGVFVALFSAIAGGLLAALLALSRGYLPSAFSNVRVMLMHWRLFGMQPVPGLTLKDSASPRLAYAIPIAIGTIWALWRR